MQRLSGAPNASFAQLTKTPVVGTSLYVAMASRLYIRNYLEEKVYFDPSYVTDEMVDHYHAAAHQYGSQYAPLRFITGKLNLSVRESFPQLEQKAIRLIWGREASIDPLTDAEPFLRANGRAQLSVLDKAGLLPHDEQASAFNRLVTEVLSSASQDDPSTGKPGVRKSRGK
jgi:pimeloyl-ACP methyl ester carboxylesterase